MDLDFWDCFGRKKALSYNQRNTVPIHLNAVYKRYFAVPNLLPFLLQNAMLLGCLVGLIWYLSMPMGVDNIDVGFNMEVQPLVTHNAS